MTTEEQIQRYKELLGLITPGKWATVNEIDGYYAGTATWVKAPSLVVAKTTNQTRSSLTPRGKESVINAEFIALSRNLAQPLLDAWEENKIYAGVVADWVGHTAWARKERDAAQEQVKALEALLSLAMPFLYDADHDISVARALAEEIKQALTPEPEPCGECGGMGYRYRPVAPGDEDNERFPCPKCQPVAEGG